MARKTFTTSEVLTAANVNRYLYNSPDITSSTATAYTLGTADINKTLQFTNTTAGILTVSTASAFVAGEIVNVLRDGTATLTVASGAGVSLLSKGTTSTNWGIVSQYDVISLQCVATNSYRVIGNVGVV